MIGFHRYLYPSKDVDADTMKQVFKAAFSHQHIGSPIEMDIDCKYIIGRATFANTFRLTQKRIQVSNRKNKQDKCIYK